MKDYILILEYVAEAFGLFSLMMFVMFFSVNLIYDRMYKKKYGPRVTPVVCPNTKKKLLDFELMYGHCANCKFHSICREKILKEVRDVKS